MAKFQCKVPKAKHIEIYDTSLRDGTQMEGISFSLEDKLMIAVKLDELGVDFIEGGFPLSNAKDIAFFKEIRKKNLKNAKICAFGMTRRKDILAKDDAGLIALQKSMAPVCCIVGKTWDFQVTEVLNVSLKENLAMIHDSMAYLKSKGREVFFDAEHFFDGWKANPEYSIKVLQAASSGGACRLVLCDTNGGSLDTEIAEIIGEVKKTIDTPLGIHTHNDSGLAVANSIVAVRSGVVQVQGTINGIGERVGNADLCTIIANLKLKMGYHCLKKNSLVKLTEISRYIYEMENVNVPMGQPYTGLNSFTHKGGMHVHAVNKHSRCYEHVSPESVGNTRRIVISELSGASNLLAKNEKLRVAKDKKLVRKILHSVQDMENNGYQFESADGSFDILVRKAMGNFTPAFELDHYRTVNLKMVNQKPVTEASVKLLVKGKVEHCVAEGDGPVNALDQALRKCLETHYPQLKIMQLLDYRVRVVNSKEATAAKVRVIIESRAKDRIFGTIGVSENLIEASWLALCDSYNYQLLK